jgi:ABC-type nitrate/sulfonate/bicarbonate transport system ATPase subunit
VHDRSPRQCRISEAIFLADRIVVMATLPGSIKEVIDVPLPHPRDRSEPEMVQKLGVM